MVHTLNFPRDLIVMRYFLIELIIRMTSKVEGVRVLIHVVRDVLKKRRVMLLTYSLTPWSRDLLGRLNGLQLIRNFLPFYGPRRFITVFTNAHHLSLS